MHLVRYLYEDYHDARSLEHKVGDLKIKQSKVLLNMTKGLAELFNIIFK